MGFGRHSCLCQYLKTGSVVPDPTSVSFLAVRWPEGEADQISPSIAIASRFRNVQIKTLLSYTNTLNFLDTCKTKYGSPSDIWTKWRAEWSGLPDNPDRLGEKSAVQVTYKQLSLTAKVILLTAEILYLTLCNNNNNSSHFIIYVVAQ